MGVMSDVSTGLKTWLVCWIRRSFLILSPSFGMYGIVEIIVSFVEREEEAKITWERAVTLGRDFRIFNFLKKHILPRPVMKKAWRKPIQGVIKINFDATITGNKMSYGLVARDHDGFVLGGRMDTIEKKCRLSGPNYWRLKKELILLSQKVGQNWSLKLIV
ncbi:hypothetical protein CXB51_003277 [Gossypium anomalum]|uniref:RNase H type-1 domain-containing protein n=1 Tax=Gossypium anomalum TaxID=47600 RepID=A0A8J5ZGV8_9ROSI|nr:hypothetical protein CXB51_003277 [Gossypium anomalum]